MLAGWAGGETQMKLNTGKGLLNLILEATVVSVWEEEEGGMRPGLGVVVERQEQVG